MKKSITDSEERLERKIAEVHQRLDAFELRVLAWQPLQWMCRLFRLGLTAFADIDTILEARVPESEAPCVEPTEDTVLAALFATSAIPPPPAR